MRAKQGPYFSNLYSFASARVVHENNASVIAGHSASKCDTVVALVLDCVASDLAETRPAAPAAPVGFSEVGDRLPSPCTEAGKVWHSANLISTQ